MTGYHLAQLNVGIVRAPTDSPELADFMAGCQLPTRAQSAPVTQGERLHFRTRKLVQSGR